MLGVGLDPALGLVLPFEWRWFLDFASFSFSLSFSESVREQLHLGVVSAQHPEPGAAGRKHQVNLRKVSWRGYMNFRNQLHVQGVPSCCALPFVDFKLKAPFSTGWQKYSGKQIMSTSKWELRFVYKVSTCLAIRRKSHLQINKICVLEYFCHPVQGVSLCGRTYVLYVLKSAKGTAHPDEPPCKHVQRTGNLILFQPSFPAFGQWTWPAWTSTCRRRRWGRESGPRRSAIPERTTGWTSR